MSNRSRLIFLVALCFLLLNGGLGWQAWVSASETDQPDDAYQYTLLFARVVQIIRQNYVDEDKTSYKALTYSALKGMLASLDPHSQFLDEDAFTEMQRETRGEFSGLGVMIGIKDNALIVLTPVEGSPSERAGILPGDHILQINGKNAEKMTLAQATVALKGKTGEAAVLTLLRPIAGAVNGGTIYTVNLVRETIRVTSVKDAKLLPVSLTRGGKIGYVRIEQFGENTSVEMDTALNQLEQQGMQALIIDLRNNPGGLLDAAVDVAGKFVPPNTLIVSTQGRSPDQQAEYRAHDQKPHPDYPIAVLINGYSASGAEIVAGALKDLHRAVLVGETTFGKGSVQTVQPLGNGVGLRLTTAKYYTPSKKIIHGVGVSPDISVPLTDVEERRVSLAQLHRPLSAEEQAEVVKVQDTQLERAVSSLLSIEVFTTRQASLSPELRAKLINPTDALDIASPTPDAVKSEPSAK